MEAFLQTLLTMSATAAVVALVVMVLRLPLKKVPRWDTCALWGVVLLRMVLPAGLSLPVSLVPQGVSSGAYVERVLPAVPAPENGGNTVLADPAPQTETSPQTPVQQATVPDTAPEESSAAPRWPAVVTGIWAAGCGVCLLWAALSYWRLRRQVAEAVRVEPGVYETDQIPSPFVCGFFRPRVYLPAGLDVADRTYVLLHERAHLRRWDHRTKVLAWLALSVHWFNPVLWLSYRLFCRDVEAACDQAVIRTFGREDTARYAEALLHLGRRTPLPAVLPLAFGEEDAKHRIRGVLTYKKPAFWLVLAAAAACVVAAVLLLSDRNPTEPQLDGEPVTSGQVVEVLALDAPWTGSPLLSTSVPLSEEQVAEGVDLLQDIDRDASSPGTLPDPLPEQTVAFTVSQGEATYYLCAQRGDLALYRVDASDACTQIALPFAQRDSLLAWLSDLGNAFDAGIADQLYAHRTPYLGSAPDTGRVLEALGFGQVMGEYTMELQTDAEPYGLTLRFQSLPQGNWVNSYLTETGRLALALIDNAGYLAFAQREGDPFLQVDKTGAWGLEQPSAEDFTTLVSVARYNIGPQDGLFSPGWAYLPTEYLYFDPRLVEDRQGTEAEITERYAAAAFGPTEDLLWLHFADGGHGSPYRLVHDPSTLSRPLDLPLSSVITTPDGQTIDLGARQDGETAFVAAFISPATGMDTGYRVYVRGEETYLALFRQDVLAYLAQVQWTVRATHPEDWTA